MKNIAVLCVCLLTLCGCSYFGQLEGFDTDPDKQEVAACINGNARATIFGQNDAVASGCRCRISPSAGMRVTEAVVSTNGECSMRMVASQPGLSPVEDPEQP